MTTSLVFAHGRSQPSVAMRVGTSLMVGSNNPGEERRSEVDQGAICQNECIHVNRCEQGWWSGLNRRAISVDP